MSTKISTSVNIAGVELKNPVMTASGTFGSGAEYSEFTDLNRLGAVVTKGVANVPWPGNPTPRVAEVYGGMLNAIGLQNPGIDVFVKRDIPFLKQFDTKIVVNVCGRTTEDYCEVVERLTSEPVDLLEINISCPNVKEGGIAFGQDPKAVEAITREVKKYAKQPIIMKLSPNVTDITEMARAAEAGGADVLSLINTLTGMKIDIERQKFAIANKTGGMPGGGICYDFGVYYLTAIVSLFGPVDRVVSSVRNLAAKRVNIIPGSPEYGQEFDYTNESQVFTILEMKNGVTGTFCVNGDSVINDQAVFTIYGKKGILKLVDPNNFGGDVVYIPGVKDWTQQAVPEVLHYGFDYSENSRGLGPSEMAEAIAEGRPNRASAKMAYHVLDTIDQIMKSAETGAFEKVPSTCERPEAMPNS